VLVVTAVRSGWPVRAGRLRRARLAPPEACWHPSSMPAACRFANLTAANCAVTVNDVPVTVERAELATGPVSVIVIADRLSTDEALKSRAAMTNAAEARRPRVAAALH
jgi:hypothetical protein